MKLKLDENLGRQCLDVLVTAGHDVATVPGQGMSGSGDLELVTTCAREGRALVTLDLDFSNSLVVPPHLYRGIAVLRLPRKPSRADLVAVVRTLVDGIERERLYGHLWSVEVGRLRIYQPPSDDDDNGDERVE